MTEQYLARLTDTNGAHHYAVNPFTHRALYGARDIAEKFESVARAQNWYAQNILCNGAFWESERQHAANVARDTRGWSFDVVTVRT